MLGKSKLTLSDVLLNEGTNTLEFPICYIVSFLAMTKCDKLHSVSNSLFLLPALLNKHAAARTTSVL